MKVCWNPGGLLCWPFQDSSPVVGLALCCFVVCSAGRFVLCLALCSFVLVFFNPFGVVVASLGVVGFGVCCWSWCFSCICSICACLVLSVSSSSWCLGRAAVCECGTPWTFLLPSFTTYGLRSKTV